MLSFKTFRFENASEEYMTKEMNAWAAKLSAPPDVISTTVAQSQCLDQSSNIRVVTTYVIAYKKK